MSTYHTNTLTAYNSKKSLLPSIKHATSNSVVSGAPTAPRGPHKEAHSHLSSTTKFESMVPSSKTFGKPPTSLHPYLQRRTAIENPEKPNKQYEAYVSTYMESNEHSLEGGALIGAKNDRSKISEKQRQQHIYLGRHNVFKPEQRSASNQASS